MSYKIKSPLIVAEGGSGAITLTGVLTGNGTSAFTANAVTQYGVVIAGASNAVTSVAPGATGIPLISQGVAANPAFGTATVPGGGTGAITLTGILTGNGTSAFTASTVTQYGTVVAGTSNAVSSIAPSATSGIPYISQGAASNPTFGTAVVAGGGTGNTTFTAYSIIAAGTTATGAFQNIVGVGALNQVLVSQGAGALPIWAAVPATAGVTSIAGTANQITASAATGAVTLSIPATFIAPGTIASTTLLTAGNAFTVTTGAVTISPFSTSGIVTNNSSGVLATAATTNHAIQIGNSGSTLTSIAVGTTGQILQAVTTGDPVWSTATYPATTTVSQILYSSATNTVAGLATANNGVLITSATGVPSLLAAGTTGQILTATTGSPATWAAPAASSISITGNSGGALTGAAFTFTGGTTGLTFSGAGSTETLTGTLIVANGGTGATTLTGVLTGNGTSAVTASTITQYGTVIAGTSNAVSSVAPSATSGVPYISQGAAANPVFGTAVVAGGGTGNTTFTAYSVICAGTTATGAFQNVSGVGTAAQVLTSNGAGALPTWQAAGGGSSFTWTVTTVNASLVAANGYIANKAGLLTMTLPASGAIGDIIRITGINTAVGWRIAQNASQQIFVGTSSTTVGVGGYIEATAIRDSAQLVCVVSGASTVWNVISMMGNLTIV